MTIFLVRLEEDRHLQTCLEKEWTERLGMGVKCGRESSLGFGERFTYEFLTGEDSITVLSSILKVA